MLGETTYSLFECLGVLTGLAYLFLAVYQRRECWIFYIVSAFAYVPVLAHQQLYLYAGMQFFFAASGAYGWHAWGKSPAQELAVHRIPVLLHVRWIAFGLLVSACFAEFLSQFGGFWNAWGDALMSIFSLIATLLTARKILEGWHYWVAVNVLAVTLYAWKEMWPTTLLYFVYLVSSAYGARRWSEKG